jgi:hypothetical protein
MPSSAKLRRVALVRTDVSEELTGAIRRNIPEDGILHSHSCENLKYYMIADVCGGDYDDNDDDDDDDDDVAESIIMET